jgi:hypothetical protein
MNRWRIILKIGGRYITKYDFGTWDELQNKYAHKIVSMVEEN